ncbi:unnamed protein product [Medioppia subpectinata]|uniref:C2 domain-containing protein n=1 Tax=Medioppia subpectinata TaxID=1979941 RepID=A0A7R9KBL2_9ACAR|nr:unnamed protein product [Medioppia subpectinata]CAG2100181.1 unnamed protein product [Medioppia subpectinata]
MLTFIRRHTEFKHWVYFAVSVILVVAFVIYLSHVYTDDEPNNVYYLSTSTGNNTSQYTITNLTGPGAQETEQTGLLPSYYIASIVVNRAHINRIITQSLVTNETDYSIDFPDFGPDHENTGDTITSAYVEVSVDNEVRGRTPDRSDTWEPVWDYKAADGVNVTINSVVELTLYYSMGPMSEQIDHVVVPVRQLVIRGSNGRSERGRFVGGWLMFTVSWREVFIS